MFGFVQLSQYRPTASAVGDGTFSETLGTATTIYGSVILHDDQTILTVHKETDILPEDRIEADGESYRVVQRAGPLEGPRRRYLLEKVNQPITPTS